MQIQKDVVYRGFLIVLSTVFFASIPLLMFLIYMAEHNFFSYDFFVDGVFGLRVFFLLATLLLVLFALGLFGWLLPIVRRSVVGHFERKDIWTLLGGIVLALYFSVLILLKWNFERKSLALLYICALSFFIALHIAFLAYKKPAAQLRSLVGLILVVVALSLHVREAASGVLSAGLRAFNAGGGVDVVLTPDIDQAGELCGSLLLLSPKHIYMRPTNSEAVDILERSRIDIVTTNDNPDEQPDLTASPGLSTQTPLSKRRCAPLQADTSLAPAQDDAHPETLPHR